MAASWQSQLRNAARSFDELRARFFPGMEITPEMRAKLDTIRLDLVNHMLIFRGPLYDNQNVLRCKADEVIGDDTLLMDINWLISGVTTLE